MWCAVAGLALWRFVPCFLVLQARSPLWCGLGRVDACSSAKRALRRPATQCRRHGAAGCLAGAGGCGMHTCWGSDAHAFHALVHHCRPYWLDGWDPSTVHNSLSLDVRRPDPRACSCLALPFGLLPAGRVPGMPVLPPLPRHALFASLLCAPCRHCKQLGVTPPLRRRAWRC